MRTRRFRVDPNGFAIVRNGIPRLSLRHQQISEELVGIRKFRVGAQPSLHFALRVVYRLVRPRSAAKSGAIRSDYG